MPQKNFYSYCQQRFTDSKVFIRQSTDNREFTYADLHRESGRIANYLTGLDLEKGDRVMVQAEKSAQNLFWYFACLRVGLIYLPLNPAYLQHEVEYFVNNAEPSLVLCDPEKETVFKAALNQNNQNRQSNQCPIILLDAKGVCSVDIETVAEFTEVDCDEDDVAVILYTSGTTGKPKGAMITHGNLVSNGQTLTEAWQWRQDDVMLHALPTFHIHGLFVATHLPVMNGSTILFLQKFDPQEIIQRLPESTVYMGVPTNYVRLLAQDGFTEAACRNMRLFTSGSAPLLAQTFAEFQDRTSHTIVERYGMTETGMNTSNPIAGDRKPGTVGPALPGVRTLILDESGNEVELSAPGNLLVKGKNVFKGYWRMPEKTAEEFTPDGYFKTGDIASQDDDGYIAIIGRDKDMIITGGLNVYPKEIEAVIDDMPGVLESAVIGLPHADFGEAVSAVVVKSAREDPLDDQSIIAYMKSRVAGFKVAKQVYFVDELPRNAMGKVQKNVLREMYK